MRSFWKDCWYFIRHVPYPWIVVILALLGQMGWAWPSQGIPVLYPFMRDEIGLSRVQLGLISSALGGGGIVTGFLGGWITDLIGVRRVVLVILFTMGLLMISLHWFSSFLAILVIGFLVGMSQGPGPSVGTRAIMDWLPSRLRASSMGIKESSVPLGGALAAGILPIVALAYGWNMAAVILGFLILGIGIVFLMLYRDAPRDGTKAPSLNPTVLRNMMLTRGLVMGTLWVAIYSALFMIILTYLILYLVEELNIPFIVAGGYLAIAQVSSVIGRIAWGASSDYFWGGKRAIVLGYIGILSSASLLALSLLTSTTPPFVIVLLVIIIGGTAMSWTGVFITLIGELVGTHHTGTALGAVSTVARISQITLTPFFGFLLDAGGSYSLAWAIAALVGFLVTLAILIFGKEPRQNNTIPT